MANDGDCDDLDADIHPDADEICDDVDNNCDGSTDGSDATDPGTWYGDGDSDGYGDDADSVDACDAPAATWPTAATATTRTPTTTLGRPRTAAATPTTTTATDRPATPTATATAPPPARTATTPTRTRTPTRPRSATARTTTATAAPTRAAPRARAPGTPTTTATATGTRPARPKPATNRRARCRTTPTADDADADSHPGGVEICDGADNDCDGATDEDAADATTWYRDSDRDGYGDPSSTKVSCSKPSGYVDDDSDCDDTDGDVNPGADEVCNGVDDDCDGTIDENSAVDASTWYADDDDDGFGDPATSQQACDRPTGTVADDEDCDDSDGDVNPDADEVCDEVDNDCDGVVDEDDAVDAETWYYDDDGDGYGDADLSTRACAQPTDYVDGDDDCDDSEADINPGEDDVCDGLDNDCSGSVDDGTGSNECDCHVEYYESGTYLFCEDSSSWTTAESTCDSLGYQMASINDTDENTWMVDTANGYNKSKWWFGYTDAATEGVWVWSDGSSGSYTNWHSGEPNDSGGEDCAQLNRFSDYSWNDEPCTQKFRFVCEL